MNGWRNRIETGRAKTSFSAVVVEHVREILKGLVSLPVPPGPGFEFCPAPAGFPAERAAAGRVSLMLGGSSGGGSQEMADLETALKFILQLKRQCVLYLYANTKAVEFPVLGSRNVICDEESDIHKYTDSPDRLFQATFNTFSELLSRSAVHKRVGMRMSTEEYADLGMFDKVHKLIRYISMVYGMLCSTQSAFKNLGFPAKLEAHVQA
jgi:hypothetical protein